MKLLRALFVLALIVAFFAPMAYAETQNVKVSGSIDGHWFYRRNYDLNRDGGDGVSAGDSQGTDFFMSQTQLEVAADLTDNVSTVINLLNERDWNYAGGGDTAGLANANTNEFDITLDLAYVQMKEIFYSPLTLTLGRQDIWFGRGFVIGNNSHAWDTQTNTIANEYSASTAFDAIRATLDFNPWTIDFVYSKISEGASRNSEDDIDLYVVNVNYKFSEYNAVAEAYYVGEEDRANGSDLTANQKMSNTETLGGRVQFDPISQITLGGELAYQFGAYHGNTQPNKRDRSAWAADVFGTYRWDYTWKPEITVEYVFFSGEQDLTTNSNSDYNAWNGLYRGKFWTAYNDFREWVYASDDAVSNLQPATQNQEFIQVKGSLKPLEDLLLEASFTYIWNDEDVHTGAVALSSDAYLASAVKDNYVGYEIDTQVTYDYTEDVSFGVLAGWFVPGDFFNSPTDKVASDVVATAKVTF